MKTKMKVSLPVPLLSDTFFTDGMLSEGDREREELVLGELRKSVEYGRQIGKASEAIAASIKSDIPLKVDSLAPSELPPSPCPPEYLSGDKVWTDNRGGLWRFSERLNKWHYVAGPKR